MKTLFTLIALGSVAFTSADQYNQPYGNDRGYGPASSNGAYYQDQSNEGNYYRQNPRQNLQVYTQRDDRGYPVNNPYSQQQTPRNQGYDQNQQYYYQQAPQSYNQNQLRTDNNWFQGNDPRVVSNQELAKKIHDELSGGWFSKGFKNVSFDVNNGIVNLRGTIDTLENRKSVEDSLRKIEGVRQINNQITIAKETPNAYSDSQLQDSEKKYPLDVASNQQDRELNAKIREKLSSGWFSKGYETLVIRTTNGVVIISGTVEQPEDVQKINDQVKNVEGVKGVNTQLRVNNG